MPDLSPTQVSPEIQRIVEAARDVWIRRLVDHSRANTLLFYRDLKVGTLDLSRQDAVVERLLSGDSLDVDQLLPPPSDEAQRDPIRRERERADEHSRVFRALVAIQRKALGNLEEKGIETLHLAYGMATWPAADGGRPYNAPVLLLPAKIEARGQEEELRLTVAGEPKINPVLIFVLEENLRVRIDADTIMEASAGEDEAGKWAFTPERALAEIGNAGNGIRDFSVTRRVVLGNFQFAKMAMVEDLRRNGDAISQNPVIAAIAGHEESRRRLAESVVDSSPAALDDRPPADDYLVLDADSTQQRAIVLVCNGQNGVVQGPPGTGKSQTIANLITQSVAEGKRVLFVAEKRAALEAVIKRLSHPAVGLGHLVLDLHGASVSRKEVMSRLASALEQMGGVGPVRGEEDLHREFEARRRQLNEHARRVNVPLSPAELSLIQILGRLLQLPPGAVSPIRFRGTILTSLTRARFDELRQLLRSGVQPSLLLGTDTSPWNDADIRDGRTAQLLLDKVGSASLEQWPRFESALNSVIAASRVRPPETIGAVGTLISVLRDVRRVRDRYNPAIFEARPGDLAEKLFAAQGNPIQRAWAFLTDSEYRSARTKMRSLRNEPAPVTVLLAEARQAAEVLERWRELRPEVQVPGDTMGAAELGAAWTALRESLAPIERVVKGGPLSSMPVQEAGNWIRSLACDARTPYQLPVAHETRDRFTSGGLSLLLDDLRDNNVEPALWPLRFEYAWLYSTFESALAADPVLAAFSGRTHEQVVADFVRLDKERVRLSAHRVRRLAAERAVRAMNDHYQQGDIVRREASKRSRHMPLRELFAKAPDVLTRIAPCWVASPLSVSQLLDSGQRHFDLVIFDEASQVLQEEAIPALYRAGQVVVAGDRHQLPPTTFFATTVDGEDDVEEGDDDARLAMETAAAAIGGFESLLGTLEAFLPNWMLEWHYRSEDERLISFSNEHIYNRRLVTFPSARTHEAIRHVLVPHDAALGSQEDSASREVEEVVRLVIEHATSRPRESLGVIAMGIKHSNRIQAALDRALEARPDLASIFSLDKDERFFVKNLETVQGDERDAVILTVGYGKSVNGDLPHRFGPLTQETGHRRLNVAVTRARRRLTLVSSFSHQEVDLERSGSRGVRLLKAYIEYAANGGTRLPASEEAGEVPLNAFEADVRDALSARGIPTRPQFGASRYRIDLVAMHPQTVGRPILAIECDGASYHSSATARDRDRLRQAHLMRLGWRFHRIWSTDWFYSREQEVERVVAAYEGAVRQVDMPDASDQRAEPVETMRAMEKPAEKHTRGPLPHVPSRDSIDQYTNRELRSLVDWVCSDGLLRTEEDTIREVFELLPFDRMGSRIRDRLTTVAREAPRRRP